MIRPELRADRPQALGTKNYDLMVIGTGSAMNLADKDYFVKVTMEKETERILGAHIGGMCFDALSGASQPHAHRGPGPKGPQAFDERSSRA